jgi:hypothetical protein
MTARNWLVAGAAVLAAACAHYGAELVPGQSSIADVERVMGVPTAVREKPDGEKILWYSKLPFGRESYAARVDPNGKLVAFEQRLTDQNISKIRRDASTADDVLDILGPPYRRSKFPRKDGEVWEYPLRTPPEPMTLFVELSPDGVVRNVYKLHDRFRPGGQFFGGDFAL